MGFIKRNEKSFGGGMWRPLTGYTSTGYIDWFGAQREPSKLELIAAYDDIIFSCVQLISNRLASVDLRLYCQTNPGQSLPKCRTKALSLTEKKSLSKSPVRSLVLRKSSDFTEVIEHPLLNLLHQPCHNVSYYDLIRLTSAYIEVTGNAYWLLKRNKLDVPYEAVVLPAHCVTPLPDLNDVTRVRGFQYIYGYGVNEQVIYRPEQVVHFHSCDLLNPFLTGLPPVRAIWQRQLLAQKELSMLQAVLNNSSRMDGILTPEEGMGWAEAERLSKEVTQRFRGAGTGGWFVAPEKMTVSPLNWLPKDMSALTLYEALRKAICAAFSIPPTVFDSGSNRAEKESDLYYLATFSLVPRLIGIAQKLNQQLVPSFDNRLWLEFDSPVPADKQYLLQERTTDLAEAAGLLQNGVCTREEVRLKYGFSAEEWAREPLIPNTHQALFPDEDGVNDIPLPETAQDAKPAEEKDYTAQVVALQTSYYAGTTPRDAAISAATILFHYSEADAQALFPEQADDSQDDTATVPAEASTPGEVVDASNSLRATVGGSAQVMAIQGAYYSGTLPRDAAIGNLMVMFGFSQQEAELLLPMTPPDAPAAPAPPGPAEPPGPAPDAQAPPEPPAPKGDSLDVPDLRQEGDFDCGAAAVRSVLAYHGQELTEEECIRALGTTHENGTSEEAICKFCKAQGYNVTEGDMSPEEIGQHTQANRPVICSVEDDKHWVVACGVQGDTMTVQDPLKGKCEMKCEKGYGIAVGKEEKKCLCCPEDTRPLTKALTSKERKISKVMKKFFRVQRQQILDRVSGNKAAGVWDIKTDLSNWTGAMTEELLPLVLMSGEEGVIKTVQRLGGIEGLKPAVQPKLKEALKQATMRFCEDTNQATSLQLETAKERLRETLAEGLSDGDMRNALRKRVQEIFDHADNDRADRVAVTEASRAQHTGQYLCAEESGLVKGFKWLLSSMPCPQCQQVADQNPEVKMGDNFFSHGEERPAEYRDIKYPPLHPGCQCSVSEVLA